MNIEIIPHFYIKRQREKNNIIIFIIYFKKYCFIKKCLFHNQIAQNTPYLSKVMGGLQGGVYSFFFNFKYFIFFKIFKSFHYTF